MQNRILAGREWPTTTHGSQLLPPFVALDLHFVNFGSYRSLGNKARNQIRPPNLEVVDLGLKCRNLLLWYFFGDEPIVNHIAAPRVGEEPNQPLIEHITHTLYFPVELL